MELFEATEEEKKIRDCLTHEAWGQSLSLEQYLERERVLRSHPWCKNGLKTWLLKEANGSVLASCETYQMQSKLTQGSIIREGISYGIASVYTEPKYRKRGYSSELLKKVIESSAIQTRPHSFILYSEIGESLYQRLGFQTASSCEWIFPVASPLACPNSTRFLNRLEIRAGRDELIKMPTDRFSIWPTLDQIEWHLSREDIYSQLIEEFSIHGQEPFLERKNGVQVNGGSLIWMIDYKYQVLRVLLISARSTSIAHQLIQAAISFAFERNLTEVRVWDSNEISDWFSDGSSEETDLVRRKVMRSDSLAMVLPLSAEVQLEALKTIPRGIWV